MSNLERVSALFEAVGPFDPQIGGVVGAGPDRWVVGYEDASVVAEYDAERDCLVLSGDIGAPPESRKHAVHELLLRYNSLRPDTGGIAAALDADGEARLLADIAAEGLDERGLAATLGNLCAKVRIWRSIVATGPDPVETDSPLDSFAVRI